MKRLKTKHGFTIVEVLVTTIVIIILGTVTVVSYDNVQSEARDKTRLSNANIIAQGLENYYNKNGEYPSVASIVGQTGSSVQQKLDLRNADVLVLPGAAPGTTNSFTQDNPSATEYAYNGESTTESEASQCISDPNGGCDQFDLQWQNEAGVVINEVGFVEDDDLAGLAGSDIGHDIAHGLQLAPGVGVSRVDDVQNDVGAGNLFQGGTERLDQLMREIAHETDRIGQREHPAVCGLGAARRRVQRGEQRVFDQHTGLSEPV